MNKSKKGLIIGIVIAVLVVAGILAAVLIPKKSDKTSSDDEAYRVISVYEMEGDVTLTRDKKDIEPYVKMHLLSGDNIKTAIRSTLQMKMDEDKYVLVEEESEVDFEATGTAKDSKTKINLKSGAVDNCIRKKLSDDSTYEVNTPNATMACRGTTFRAMIYKDADGTVHTVIQCMSGKVEIHVLDEAGQPKEETIYIEAGKEASIYSKTSGERGYDYEDEDIDYSKLPLSCLKFLEMVSEDGEDISIDLDELEDLIETKSQEFTVTFVYTDEETNSVKTFGTQTLLYEQKAVKPKLQPTESGSWGFDFTTPITEDTTVTWKPVSSPIPISTSDGASTRQSEG